MNLVRYIRFLIITILYCSRHSLFFLFESAGISTSSFLFVCLFVLCGGGESVVVCADQEIGTYC